MRRFYFGQFIVSCLSLIALNAMAEETLTCSPSEQVSVEYKNCSHETHKPIYKAQISDLCNNLPQCSNSTLTDDDTCKITTNALVADKHCGVKEYNFCDHIEISKKPESRDCSSQWYDGVGGDNSCKEIWNGSDRCSRQWLLSLYEKDSQVNVVSATLFWKDQKLITGHRLKASHQCEFKFQIYRSNKVSGPAPVCGAKEFHKCMRPGYSQCRHKEFGIQTYSSKQSKVCGVKSIAPISQQASSDKRCLKCDHLPKDSDERFKCLMENKKLGKGLSADMRKKIRTEIFDFLQRQFKKGKVVNADREDIIRILRTLTDKEYERIVWSFFIGEVTGIDGRYLAPDYLNEVVRSEHSTSWVFFSKMQQAFKEFKYWGVDRYTQEIYYLLHEYFVRAYVSELEKLRSDRFKVMELAKAIQGKGKLNTKAIVSQAKAVGLSDELIVLLQSKLNANSTGFENSILITVLSDLSESLKRESDQVSNRIKESISEFSEVEEKAKFLNVYLNIANLDMRSALLEVRNLSRTVAYEYEWLAGYKVQDNIKMTLVRKIKATNLLLKKMSEENVFCTDASDDLLDLDPALAAFLMQAKVSKEAQVSGCEVAIQAAQELLHKHYLQPLMEIKAELRDKE